MMTTLSKDSAAEDLVAGLLDWPLWLRLGWYDVVSRYRRSWVGPLWLVATTMIFVVSLGFVYSVLFKVPVSDYMPFVALGTVIWTFISAVTSESLQTFVEAEVYMRQVRRSPMIYSCRVVWRNVIIFANQFAVALLVAIFFGKFSLAYLPLTVIGFIFLVAQAVWINMFLSILGTRFRDLGPIIQNVLQVLFFITPILWTPTSLGANSWIAQANPVYHLIQILRAPILGQAPELLSYLIVCSMTVIGFAASFYFYSKFRQRIVYWL
jgi:ABC-type polysaccharide/polyol phosphate export permease